MGIEVGPRSGGESAPSPPSNDALVRGRGRRRLAAEVWLVLGLSLGQSAVYSVVNLIDKFTRGPIRDQTSVLIAPQSPRPYLDLTYQLLGIGFALVPVQQSELGTKLTVRTAARGEIDAVVVPRPFIDPKKETPKGSALEGSR